MNNKRVKKQAFGLAAMVVTAAVLSLPNAYAMKSMSDNELAATQGQSLFSLAYTAPGANNNPNVNTGIYRLGIEASLELNANIKTLQLGCGGVNGANGCDVDLRNVSFTGFAKDGVQSSGVGTDFLADNPFVEFAVANPTSASTRQITGLRVGFGQVAGMLSANIKSLTATQDITVTNGTVPLYLDTLKLTGSASTTCTTICIPLGAGTISPNSPNAGDNIFHIATARASSFNLNPLKVMFNGLVATNANLTEDYSYIRSLALGSQGSGGTINYAKDFYISLSSLGDNAVANGVSSTNGTSGSGYSNPNNIQWQKSDGTWMASPRGWSLNAPGVVVSPNPFTTQNVYLPGATAATAVLGSTINLSNVELNIHSVSNCYGGLTFC